MEVESASGKLRELSEKDIEINKECHGYVWATIDRDVEEDIPIDAIANDRGSYCVFTFAPEEEGIRILAVHSEKEGDMAKLFDLVVDIFDVDILIHWNIMNKDILNKIHGISTKTIQVDGEPILVGANEWESEQRYK